MWRRYRKYRPGEFVICFVDTAAGGIDYCAAQFLSKTAIDVPVVYHSRVLASEMTPLIHAELEAIFEKTGIKPVVAYETNNGAIFELERLARLNRLQKYKIYTQKSGTGTIEGEQDSNKLGFSTNIATRPAMLGLLKEAIDNGLITIYDKPTINEMFSFIVNQTNSGWKAQAEVGAHDDLVMSLAGAWQLYQTENPDIKLERTRERPARARFHV